MFHKVLGKWKETGDQKPGSTVIERDEGENPVWGGGGGDRRAKKYRKTKLILKGENNDSGRKNQ